MFPLFELLPRSESSSARGFACIRQMGSRYDRASSSISAKMGSRKRLPGMALPAWIFAATVAWSNFAAAEVQVGSTVNSEGPGPAVGPRNLVGSADNPPTGTVTGAIQSIAADPSNASTLYVGAADGGIWKTTDGRATGIAAGDQRASLSLARQS